MSADANLIASLNYLTVQINRHAALLIIAFGTVGNLLNLFVLRDRSFRENPCAIYLSWSSAVSILFIWSGLSTRILDGYGIDWPNRNPPLCKIRLFILTTCWSMATWAFAGATMDRYFCCHPSVTRHRRSTHRTARQFLLVLLLISVLLFAEIFYCYEANVPRVPVACNTQLFACQLYNDWMSILFIILIPSMFMAAFGVLTVLNVRGRVVQPLPNNGSRQPRPKKIDRHLRKILLVQILILLVLNLPIGIQRFYANVTSNLLKSSLRVAVENLIYAIIVLIRFVAYSISFYVYILTGSLFRHTFQRTLQRRLRCLQRSQPD